ncbi:MAG: toll/interleukin-1 receptor domain-containing protein, partial [Chloroflexota bacterium]
MQQPEKSVFISYRRTSGALALLVYQHLTQNDYNVFLDNKAIGAGSFERVILSQIEARPHFVLILTPSALERCTSPEDWLRREIEHAIAKGRNIVPLMFEKFTYEDNTAYLTGQLAQLPRYNSLPVPSVSDPDYFNTTMTKLREQFLNKLPDAVLRPITDDQQSQAEAVMASITPEDTPSEAALEAVS